jgi:hypothetical protein
MTFLHGGLKRRRNYFFLKKRKYAHFDGKIRFDRNIKFFESFFSKPDNVAKHSFYPLIKTTIVTPQYKKTGELDEKGKPIRKKKNKPRPIAFAAHFDAFLYSWYSTILTERYEQYIKHHHIENCVLAYLEKGKNNIHFAKEIFDFINEIGNCTVLAFDISSFFDGLCHEILMNSWLEVMGQTRLEKDHYAVYKSLTNYTFVNQEDLLKLFPAYKRSFRKKKSLFRICEPHEFRTIVRKGGYIKDNPNINQVKGSSRHGLKCGIPQGSPISACLSNIYMINFDKEIKAYVHDLCGAKGMYRRYSDDLIVVCPSDKASIIERDVLNKIKEFNLVINEKKTEITVFKTAPDGSFRGYVKDDVNFSKHKNLQYLGFEFNGEDVFIRSSSMSRYYKRMSSRVRENIRAAYGKNAIGEHIFKEKLYERYTAKGKRNFITYAKLAAKEMNSDAIKR